MKPDDTKSRGHGDKRPRKRDLLIAMLLQHSSVEAAAAAAGIARKTAYRWWADDSFRRDLAAAQRETLDCAMTLLQQASTRAAANLDQLQLAAEAESVRMNCSRSILEFSLRSAELQSVEQRLAALEEALNRKGDKRNGARPGSQAD